MAQTAYSLIHASAQLDAARYAKERMRTLQSQNPGTYQSQYKDRIDAVAAAIDQRAPFQYDVNTDPMYRQYRQQMQQQGKAAMEDTLGTAAALTGGYGSSWGTTTAGQTYQSYLGKIGDLVPTLYQTAYDRYRSEGSALQEQLNSLSSLDATAQSAHQQTVDNWRKELDSATSYYQYLQDLAYQAQQDEQAQANWRALHG